MARLYERDRIIINFKKIETALKQLKDNQPFDYCVVDRFFDLKIAKLLEKYFPNYDDPSWFENNNPLENKKALNDWTNTLNLLIAFL